LQNLAQTAVTMLAKLLAVGVARLLVFPTGTGLQGGHAGPGGPAQFWRTAPQQSRYNSL